MWELGRTYAPAILKHFEILHEAIGTSHEQRILESIYAAMPSGNFSMDLSTQAVNHIGLLPMKDILWSDCGRGERIIETLRQIGKLPNFPMMAASGNRTLYKSTGNLSIAR
jgi:hypothetical protein